MTLNTDERAISVKDSAVYCRTLTWASIQSFHIPHAFMVSPDSHGTSTSLLLQGLWSKHRSPVACNHSKLISLPTTECEIFIMSASCLLWASLPVHAEQPQVMIKDNDVLTASTRDLLSISITAEPRDVPACGGKVTERLLITFILACKLIWAELNWTEWLRLTTALHWSSSQWCGALKWTNVIAEHRRLLYMSADAALMSAGVWASWLNTDSQTFLF